MRRQVTILLVEHDMEAVFALADRITVLVYGRVIASGMPEAIRSNEEVKRAYLGDQHAVTPMTDAPLLEIAGIETFYGLSQVLFGMSLHGPHGRDRGPDGPQRHGQDHDGPLDHGPAAGARGRHPVRRPGIRGLPSFRIAQLGIGLVPEGRQIFPNLSVRENLVAASGNRLGASDPWTLERSTICSRGWPSAAAIWAARSRAASSRCWRSAAR